MITSLRQAAAAAAFAAASLAGAGAAQAQATLQTDIDIDFPSIIILNCFDEIDVSFTGAQLLAALGVASNTVASGTGTTTAVDNAGALEGDAGPLLATPGGTVSSVLLNLNGVCAVRAVGTGGVVNADLTLDDGTLTGAGGSTIAVNALNGRDGGSTAAGSGGAWSATTGGPTDFTVATNGLGQLSFIDVQLDLDLSGVTAAGEHSGAADTFTVSVAAP